MESIYNSATKITYEEFKRFSWAVMRKRTKTMVALILTELLAMLTGIIVDSSVCIVFAVIYPFMLVLLQNRQVKKTYLSNKLMQDTEVKFEFFDSFFNVYEPDSNAKVEYGKLYEVIETKSNFYLMISQNQGFILRKADMPSGLGDFLKEQAMWINAKNKRK